MVTNSLATGAANSAALASLILIRHPLQAETSRRRVQHQPMSCSIRVRSGAAAILDAPSACFVQEFNGVASASMTPNTADTNFRYHQK